MEKKKEWKFYLLYFILHIIRELINEIEKLYSTDIMNFSFLFIICCSLLIFRIVSLYYYVTLQKFNKITNTNFPNANIYIILIV